MSVFFVGAADQARMCQRILAKKGYCCPYGFDENRKLPLPWPHCAVFSENLEKAVIFSKCTTFMICIADMGRGRKRLEFAQRLIDMDLTPMNVVHETAFIENGEHGSGLQMMAGSQFLHGVQAGNYVTIGANVSVDHDTILRDGATVASGAIICGRVDVGECASIGAGATVLPRMKIGKDAIVGAGAVVTRNVPDGVTVVGVPARVR